MNWSADDGNNICAFEPQHGYVVCVPSKKNLRRLPCLIVGLWSSRTVLSLPVIPKRILTQNVLSITAKICQNQKIRLYEVINAETKSIDLKYGCVFHRVTLYKS